MSGVAGEWGSGIGVTGYEIWGMGGGCRVGWGVGAGGKGSRAGAGLADVAYMVSIAPLGRARVRVMVEESAVG